MAKTTRSQLLENLMALKEVIKRAEGGGRAAGSTLLLSLVMEKEPQSRRMIWKCFVKMQHMLPKLDKLLDEVEQQGSDLMKSLKHMHFVPELSDHLKDPKSTLSELLTQWDDYKLFQLGNFYQDRLTEAIEGRVEGLSQLLRNEGHFSGREHEKVSELVEKGHRIDASKLFLNLVTEKGSQTRTVMWKSFVEMRQELPKLDKILKEIQEFGSDTQEYMNMARGLTELPTELKDVQQKHKRTLRQQTETLRVNTILMREKVKVFQLVDRYAELTVISTVRRRRLVEHELLARGRDHEEWREEHLRGELGKIRTDQLFQGSLSWSKSKSGSSVAVAGVPGIGKTTMVQKIVYDWATGKIYQQFQFVFSFKFRDLNTINCTINLWNLMVFFYPYLRNVLEKLWKNPEKLLFIFDGLDEFNDTIDFGDCRKDTKPQQLCTDPEFRCKVSDIVYSLIQHKLLPGCSVLVTTRPTALHLLEKAEISVWAEILGFVGEERKEYFSRYFEDQAVAAAVFKHVEENEILYTMSYNPSYCWILCLALGPFFTERHRDPQRVPKTITQLYSYYIYNILKNHSCKIESPRDVLLRVGQMAFTGVSERKIVFTDGDLIKYNLQPSQFLSGFLMELLEREDCARSVVYAFPHLTIQEFAAALVVFLTADPSDIMERLSDFHSEEDGRFEIFLRFVAGLCYPESARGLEEILGPFPNQTTCRVIDWVKAEVKRQIGNTGTEAGKRRLLNTLHYLFESQNRGLAQAALGAVETLSLSDLRLNPIDCAVLSHVIGLCDTIKLLDLYGCHIQCEGLQRLGPELHKCQELRLGSNKLGDSGVKPVSKALRHPECKIRSLELENVGLTGSGAEDLVYTLSANGSLLEINLSNNELGDSGVKPLPAALGDPTCKIQRLWLEKVGLTDSGAEELVSILTANRSLMEINLCGNKLGISGVKLVCAALKDPQCKIQRLELDGASLSRDWSEDLVSALSTNDALTNLDLDRIELGDSGVKLLSAALNITKYKMQRLKLCGVGLTGSAAEDLVSALSTSRSLTELDLSYNELGDSGVKVVPLCKIQRLRLEKVGLTGCGAEDLLSAFSTNCSLTDLDLGCNELGDAAVKLVSEALRNPECKIQRLRLWDVGLTDSGVEDLVSALSTNRSLTELELGYNSLTDRSVPAIRRLILSHPNLKCIWLLGNKFGWTGKKELRSLQEPRPGLQMTLDCVTSPPPYTERPSITVSRSTWRT
ncbi:NACHT, LRR and PYD domains-containing protein 3-like isoform X2 [Pristis pectinata]|uniref:NACHT, LRR and PYD domains-containing protein 3-like isoform X2 n=1 Tax=Pristis pectinata TaxID=685728 RepID=UPI00223D0463|nr:NACHT, LRR and PYD domains-containing protein 3-like isoform X2 [Pristis pectinata]